MIVSSTTSLGLVSSGGRIYVRVECGCQVWLMCIFNNEPPTYIVILISSTTPERMRWASSTTTSMAMFPATTSLGVYSTICEHVGLASSTLRLPAPWLPSNGWMARFGNGPVFFLGVVLGSGPLPQGFLCSCLLLILIVWTCILGMRSEQENPYSHFRSLSWAMDSYFPATIKVRR